MMLGSGDVILRPFRDEDAPKIALLANNPKIGRNLREGFPYPYTEQDALNFIRLARQFKAYFAIDWKHNYAGNISLTPLDNVYKKTAEIGYFLGEPYWNKGIMTAAVNLITDYGFKELGFARIHTGVYEYNPASQRVLEKCGYSREGIFRKSIWKENRLWDEIRFARINPELEKTGHP